MIATASGTSCSDISNAVREVFYTVYYAPVGGVYAYKKVVYDLVIKDNLDLCAGASSSYLYKMKFGIRFLPFTESE